MNKQIEALKMAIEAIEYNLEWYNIGELGIDKSEQAIQACKEALAEAEKQEPVKVVASGKSTWVDVKPTWQSLSDDEIQNELKNMWDKGLIPSYSIVAFARAVEQALKEKNAPNN